MTSEDKEEIIELETILIALDDKIHRIQEILYKERSRLNALKKRCAKCGH